MLRYGLTPPPRGTGRAPSWLRTPAPRHRPGLRLLCFPHEGGSAEFFDPWLNHLPDTAELTAVQYPGRGDRAHEPVPGQVDDLARPVAEALAGRGGARLVLFGHGMGAAVAFETARLLTEHHDPGPEALFVSSHPAPTDLSTDVRIHEGHHDDPVARLRHLTSEGTGGCPAPGPPPVPAATVYADLRTAARYRYRPGPPLECPVTALVGIHDTGVTARRAEGWRSCTTGRFTLRAMRGGPFYLVRHRAALVAFLLTSSGGGRARA
ncbi:thioesterase II family protein [Streptomyces sp. NBC_00347]|uniref:thioesterase II family protein n=1 Tax=Streptomyces sp. NBC_00347 TaxID=2975721 RepID=UPI002258FE46|nr:thioesterase domain-containing protein [Streptomyces sp. NBC_00347]MCX5127247.1 thioesterase domain-containing protein [Streptomyces sp. NBC_00347]